MKIFRLTAKCEKGERWANFEVDQTIGPKEISHFKNIGEAKGAPLIQQLFYLPFVKSVSLSETTIRVERFDILEWAHRFAIHYTFCLAGQTFHLYKEEFHFDF